ncbi:MAG: hypothetical protein AAF515_11730 [Pseudomonadota bacterium]
MDDRLDALIDAHQMAASEAFAAFVDTGLCAHPASRVAWGSNGLPLRGEIPGGGEYQKLGFGLRIERNGQTIVFEFAPDGRLGPFDEHALQVYWDENGRRGGFQTADEISAAFADALRARELRALSSGLYERTR